MDDPQALWDDNEKTRPSVHFKLILSLILAGLAVLFVIQNVAVAEVRFLVWSLQMTLSLLIFLLFAGGILAGWLLHSYWVYRRKATEAERLPIAADQDPQ